LTNHDVGASIAIVHSLNEKKVRLGVIFGVVLVVIVAFVLWNRGKPPVP
jgi:ABC-type transporter Mla subunit MlaD